MAILIVDDSADTELIKRILEDNGFYDIIIAGSVTDAFAFLRLDQPSCDIAQIELVLVNAAVQGEDGIKLCRLIKSHQCFKEVPVIVNADGKDTQILDKAFAAGAVDFISKPIKPLELKARVHSALKSKVEIDQHKAREAELVKVLNKLGTAIQELSRISTLDELTGIANRRHFDQVYDKECRRAVRAGYKLSVIFLDSDFFKLYNDTYGHQEGDECLKQIAAAAGSVLKRPGDLLARYGGEEFVIILPQTSVQGALKIAEAIRIAVEQCKIPHSASKIAGYVTVSIGVAGNRLTRLNEGAKLLSRADKALYEAKSGGRNQARVSAADLEITEIADIARIDPDRLDEAVGG